MGRLPPALGREVRVKCSTSFLGRPNNESQCGVWSVWAGVGGRQTSFNKLSGYLDKAAFFTNSDALMAADGGEQNRAGAVGSASQEEGDQNICV